MKRDLERAARNSTAIIVVALGLVVAFSQCGCSSAASKAKPAAYGVELAACSEMAKTCEESIRCENEARKRHGRPLRTGGCE